LTNETIERFRPTLDPLEKERLKIVHDRKAFLFVALLSAFLGFLLLFSGFIGASMRVALFGLVLFIACGVVLFVRERPSRAFRRRFRSAFTREWFHAAYPGCYLAPAPEQVPVEVSRSLREACIRATAQSPSRTAIEERVFFDNESYQSWTFVLRERDWLGGVKSRALVWFRAASEETPLVAFAWPPFGLSKQPDVRSFMNGKPIETDEPLRTKLVSVYERLRAKARGQAVRVSLSPTGVWAGVKLKDSFFEAPPITASLLDPSSYASWSEEASLPTDREIVSLLFTI
jgi:hypothetical protein